MTTKPSTRWSITLDRVEGGIRITGSKPAWKRNVTENAATRRALSSKITEMINRLDGEDTESVAIGAPPAGREPRS
jgi:hypothetical protein